MQIDRDRLWRRLMQSAQIGKLGETGLCRLALSDEDRAVRDWFAAEAKALGCEVRYDAVGNIFAHYPGTDPDLPPIAIGSHLDTQPMGGRFDGILGVLGGLEVVACLAESGQRLRHPLEIVDWTNEEGSRFAPAMVASGAFAGVFPLDYVLERTDRNGLRFGDELARIGYRGAAPLQPHRLAAYFELHIEQGPVLETKTIEIGVVTGVQAIRWYDIDIIGDCCHAGTTPMAMRRDPSSALGALLTAVHDIGTSDPGRSLSTVGIIETQPGSRNTVPQSIRLTVDLRHGDDLALDAMERALFEAGETVARQFNVECAITRGWTSPAVAFDATCVGLVRDSAQALGFSHCDIVSGAGHDAVYIARVAPTAMIFVPCAEGISHNPRESITPEQAAAGAEVLLRTVIHYDGEGKA
jgi:N-carbamoyl-L-amino-acid hydrolase